MVFWENDERTIQCNFRIRKKTTEEEKMFFSFFTILAYSHSQHNGKMMIFLKKIKELFPITNAFSYILILLWLIRIDREDTEERAILYTHTHTDYIISFINRNHCFNIYVLSLHGNRTALWFRDDEKVNEQLCQRTIVNEDVREKRKNKKPIEGHNLVTVVCSVGHSYTPSSNRKKIENFYVLSVIISIINTIITAIII